MPPTVKRRQGTRSDLGNIPQNSAESLESLYAAEAKRRQSGGQGGVLLSQNSDEGNHIRTDEQLAKLAGTSRDTIRKVKAHVWKALIYA